MGRAVCKERRPRRVCVGSASGLCRVSVPTGRTPPKGGGKGGVGGRRGGGRGNGAVPGWTRCGWLRSGRRPPTPSLPHEGGGRRMVGEVGQARGHRLGRRGWFPMSRPVRHAARAAPALRAVGAFAPARVMRDKKLASGTFPGRTPRPWRGRVAPAASGCPMLTDSPFGASSRQRQPARPTRHRRVGFSGLWAGGICRGKPRPTARYLRRSRRLGWWAKPTICATAEGLDGGLAPTLRLAGWCNHRVSDRFTKPRRPNGHPSACKRRRHQK